MTWVKAVLAAVVLLRAVSAQRLGVPTEDLSAVGIDELFSVEVTSVDKKAQQLSKAPAAIYVLTADDIRRTGATSVPEALQWAPGLTVLQINGRDWVVSARGGARQYANSMLVMVDGRSLYTPLFAGMIWDAFDIPIGDIERIEIVRGPGAVTWGPNAVNGVINIITRGAARENGAAVSLTAGNQVRSASVRADAALGGNAALRAWGKSQEMGAGSGGSGAFMLDNHYPYPASWDSLDAYDTSAGMRLNARLGERDELLVQANGMRSGRQDPLGFAVIVGVATAQMQSHSDYETGAAQAVWTHTTRGGAEGSLQFTFEKGAYNFSYLNADVNNLTLDYQLRRKVSERHELYWSAGFQQYWDAVPLEGRYGYRPEPSAFRDGNVTFRDEFQASPQWLISAGIRGDYDTYTRFEWQPSVRVLYTPARRQSLWMSWSRAVGLPSRFDRDLETDLGAQIWSGMPVSTWIYGSREMRAQTERSWEAGYRYQHAQVWSVDLSLFRSTYTRMRATQIGTPEVSVVKGVPAVSLSVIQDDAGSGATYGGEISGKWQVAEKWRVIPLYSYLNEARALPQPEASPDGPFSGQYAWDNALAKVRHQGQLRSQHDLTRRLQLDLMVRAHSRVAGYNLPGVMTGDVRLGFRPARTGELSLTVRNVAGRKVLEAYAEGPLIAIPIRRTLAFGWTQRF